MPIHAILFDLDGTLTDTNELHARAFAVAFDAFEYQIAVDRIITLIGMGGDRLMPRLIGEEATERFGDTISECKDNVFKSLVEEEGTSVLPGVVELLDDVRSRGIRTAIATGSKKEALDQMMTHAAVDLREHVDAVTTATDVDHTKPHPDTVHAALDKLDADAGDALLLGDTPYDAESAGRAEVRSIGVLTGVHDEASLREAGMDAIFQDANDLRGRLDDLLGE